MKMRFAAFAVAALVPVAAVVAQTVPVNVVNAMRVGTTWSGIPTGSFDGGRTQIAQHENSRVYLRKTANGFEYVHACGSRCLNNGQPGAGGQVVQCNNVGAAGGRGNATVNCALVHGQQVRFEWTTNNTVKYEYWVNMAAKAGQTQNKPGQATATLTAR